MSKAERLGVVDPKVAQYYLGSLVVKTLMNGSGRVLEYEEPTPVDYIGEREVVDGGAV